MTISLFSPGMADCLPKFLEADDRSRLAEVSKEAYQKMNTTEIWRTLGLGDFIRDGKFWTMREIFNLNPDISDKVRDAAMIELARMVPVDSSGKFCAWNRLDATTGEWRILLELFKRGASFPIGEKYSDFQQLVECSANHKGVSDIYVVLHRKGLLSKNQDWNAHFRGVQTAVRHGHDETLEVMLNEFDVSNDDINAEFIWTAREGHLSILKILSEEASSLGTSLEAAAANGHKPIVIFLLQTGTFSDAGQFKAIDAAKQNGHPEVVDVLLLNYKGKTEEWLRRALEIALQEDKTELVKAMLNEPNAKWELWGPVLREALERGKTEIVEYIAPYFHNIPETYHCWIKALAEENYPELLPSLSGKSRESQESVWISTAKVATVVAVIVIMGISYKASSDVIRKRFT